VGLPAYTPLPNSEYCRAYLRSESARDNLRGQKGNNPDRLLSASGQVVEAVRALRLGESETPRRPIEPKTTHAWSRQPRARIFGKKRRGLSSLAKPNWSRHEEVLSNDSGSDPFCHSIPTVKSTSVFGKVFSFAGGQSERKPNLRRAKARRGGPRCGCVQAREWDSIPSRTHRG